MKDTVLQRAMFVAPVSKKTMNSGIMAGFEEDDDMLEEAMAEEMPPMARSPQNPEILMNNLRGDVRSVDARYLELAQMVGEEAAMETPPEVLAMLQGQMGAQAAMPPPPPPGGIGALPQAPQMAAAPMMPPGMEGAAPFPQGGVSAAPPTPDGLPPLRAKDGVFATQDARFGTQEFPVSYQGNRIDQLEGNMDRMLQLASGEIPPEQMTTEDMRLLDAYSKSMGFTGGSIRDVARQGFGRIGSALEPYVARGREALSRLDEQLGGMLPPSFRVVPMRDKMLSPTAKGRAVIPERDNIVAGPGGMPQFQIPRNPRTGQPPTGAGNRVTAANTLNVERIPLSQAVRESFRVNPKATTVAGGIGLGTAAGMLANLRGEGGGESGMTPEQLLEADRRISKIPNEFSPNTQQRFTFDARDANQYALDAGEEIVRPSDVPAPGGDANTPGLKLNAKVGIQPPSTFLPPPNTEKSAEEGRNLSELVKTLGEKPVAKTRTQRIKEEYEGLSPMFKELLGDTKSDIRANALLLLGEAGFKYGSTWAPTPAMALSQAMSGLPRGFAALAAQARDRDIKIKTATLQSAMDNINLQDKLARDLQLENLRGYNRAMVENLRQSGILKGKLIESDTRLMEKQIEAGGLIEEDLGAGLTGVKKKNGSYVGEYFRTQKDPNTGVVIADPVVQQILDSRYTLRGPTDNPYVVDRGPAPTFSARDKKSRDELLNGLRALDDSLRSVDDLEQDVMSLYSPGTWTVNAVNNVLVPLSFGAIKPNVEEKQAITKVTAGVNRLVKSLGRSNDTGRVSVYEQQEVANGVLNNLTGPTGFLENPELAAGSLSSIKTGLLNSRQQILTQLGLADRDLQARNPALGTPSSPFVIPQDDNGRRAMGTYLRGAFRGVTDPKAMTYVSIDGAVRGIPIVEFLKGEGVR